MLLACIWFELLEGRTILKHKVWNLFLATSKEPSVVLGKKYLKLIHLNSAENQWSCFLEILFSMEG